MTIGEKILQQRLARGLLRSQLSSRSGVSVSTIKVIEKGKTKRPWRETVEKLLTALNIPIDPCEHERPTRRKKKRAYQPRYVQAREATGRTMAQSAVELRIKANSLAKIEAGVVNPTVLQLIHMSELYGRTIGWLVGRECEIYAGRRCCMGAPCAAGKVRDFCCTDCPERDDCEDRCLNDPARCGLVKTLNEKG